MDTPDDPTAVEIRPAATLVLIRDSAEGPQVLMLRRNIKLVFAGGAWVFPGGRVDAEERQASDNIAAASRLAAVRETWEEAGISVDPDTLTHIAHWTTPIGSPRRFAAWFYALILPDGVDNIAVDGSEIHEYRWFRPTDALAGHRNGELEMLEPTWMTLRLFEHCPDLDSVADVLTGIEPQYFHSRIADIPGGTTYMYAGDSGHETGNPNLPGPQRRIVAVGSDWRFEEEEGKHE